MSKNRIPHKARVLVADGRKALLLKNAGDELHPNLKLEESLEAPPNPATHEHGTECQAER